MHTCTTPTRNTQGRLSHKTKAKKVWGNAYSYRSVKLNSVLYNNNRNKHSRFRCLRLRRNLSGKLNEICRRKCERENGNFEGGWGVQLDRSEVAVAKTVAGTGEGDRREKERPRYSDSHRSRPQQQARLRLGSRSPRPSRRYYSSRLCRLQYISTLPLHSNFIFKYHLYICTHIHVFCCISGCLCFWLGVHFG